MEQNIRAYAATLDTWPRRLWLISKRLIDIGGAGLGLVVLSPLLVLLGLLIRLESPGPVIFIQQRLGRYGRPFAMYKFRSMQHNAPLELNADGSTRVARHDLRVTRLGHLMRRTGLDELPQLWNVLRGDMSLIGPRPDPSFYAANYTGTDWHKLAMRPGLTALAQAIGRQTIGWRARFAIEKQYIEHTSPTFDLFVLLLTFAVIWRGTGVTAPVAPVTQGDLPRFLLRSMRKHTRPAAPPTPRPGSALMVRSGLILALVGALLVLPTLSLVAEAMVKVQPIKPILECVAINDDGTYTAYFGYLNKNDFTVTMPAGEGTENYFMPGGDVGQPTEFVPGRTPYYPDAAFVITFEGGTLVWTLGNKTATASTDDKQRCAEPEPTPEPTPAPGTIGPSDFNGDTSYDVFWRHQGSGDNGIWLMNGTERESHNPLNMVDDTDWQIVGLHDLDSDSKADVLWRHATSGENIVWLMDGASRLALDGLNTVGDTDWQIVGLNDFNGDSKADILWRHASTGGNIIWLMNGTSRIGLDGLNTVGDTDWQIVGLHDFNSDSKADILWRHATTGDNIIWFMDGAERIGVQGTNRVSDSAWQIIGAGDFDGDDDADILWRNIENGSNVIWLMDGTTRSQLVALNALSDQDWQIVSISDFDSDGKDDILWRHATTGANGIWCIDGDVRKVSIPLNTVGDTGWNVIGTQLMNTSRQTTTPAASTLAAAVAPHTSLAAVDAPAAGTPDELPGATMTDEGISPLMADEPPTLIPETMGVTTLYLPLVQR
jgi:lipopolysaccharide/colanic/teichoic acid biosynthesis glycosyltransferase/translation initiation factor IF-1